jgi:hypothetical protein
MTEQIKNIYYRMLDVMAEVSYIKKEDKKVNDQYKFVSHDAVAAKVREALLKHKVAFEERILERTLELKEVTETVLAWNAQAKAKTPILDGDGKPIEKTVTGYVCTIFMEFTFINPDAPEQRMVAQGYGMGLDTQDKATGKAMSYAKKYALLNALLLETGDDPEKDVHVNVSPNSGSLAYFGTAVARNKKWKEIKDKIEAFEDYEELAKYENEVREVCKQIYFSDNESGLKLRDAFDDKAKLLKADNG